DFAHTVWVDIRRYFVPASHPHGWYKGWDIDPQLDWSWQGRPQFTRDTIAGMTRFFSPFVPHPNPALVDFMHAYGQVFGFGGTLLAVCTSLSLLGLLAARGRHRVGVLLFGIGGLAALIGPTVGVLYMGRYVVPLAGLIAAGAAISASATAQTLARRAASSQRVVLRSRAVARIASRYG
ncbi:MAG: hypothetical protein M3018_09975, partial [Actinomycetota bacterium]|nr:hypothetical protein [Actinomycetota bacterium]